MSSDNEYLGVTVRSAKKEDMNAVAQMIQELADFEQMPNGPKISVEDLQRDGFNSKMPAFRCQVAELKSVVVGYALYFPTYSTWEGPALMLEDLYVQLKHRRHGIGEKLFNAVAKEASSTGCSRLDFHVLDWNNAKLFYEKKGAVNLTNTEQWCYYRLSGKALASVSKEPSN